MIRLILVLVAFALFACNSTESQSGTKVSAGVYQAELSNVNGAILSLEENLGADGAYRGRGFLSSGGQTCLIIEGVGDWAHHEKGFSTKNMRVKVRGGCDQELSAAEDIPDDVTEIRKVTATGFEEYFEGDDQPAQWVPFKRI
jgi:hypothetical protein